MRGLGRGGLALLGLALTVSAGVAQQPGTKGEPAAPAGWWGSWWGGKPRADNPKPEAGRGPAESRPAGVERGRELERHMNAYTRRIQVCDRLREVARETNDAILAREADRLEELAWDVYQGHTAHLTGEAPVPAGAAGGDAPSGAPPVRSAAALGRGATGAAGRGTGLREDK